MAFFRTTMMALALALSVSAAPASSSPLVAREGQANNETAETSGSGAGLSIRSAPNWYDGPWWNFPGTDSWLGWEDMWQRNDDMMLYAGNTWDDIGRVNVAIWQASEEYSIDPRVLLAIIMQESHGYVGVRTTYSYEGIPTAGVMQCSYCPGFPGRNNLPQEDTTSMIRGGAAHFRENLNRWGGNGWDASSVYNALREYNSGVVNEGNLSDGVGATDSYVSDVVQRLGGWYD